MPDKYDAVVAGHLCLDILPDLSGSTAEHFHKTFAPGRLLSVGPAAYATGGAANNTGLVLHKLGIPTRIVGKVGNDIFGQAIVQIIAGYGSELADRLIVDPAATTSYTIVISPPGDDRIFLHCPGANDGFDASDICYEILDGARLFHFGYPPLMRRMYESGGEQLAELYRRARQTGVTTSLDMALPDPGSDAGRADWVGILRKTLPDVDVCLPSFEEMLFMLRRETYEELARQAGGTGILPLVTPALLHSLSQQMLDMGTRIAGLKLGYRGFYLRTGDRQAMESLGRARPASSAAWANRELWSPCFKVDVVGTAGSGDATIAGFLGALLRDLPPAEAVTAAVAVGACNVEAADTISGVRAWDQTMQRIAAGWERQPLELDAPGWHHDEATGVWTAT